MAQRKKASSTKKKPSTKSNSMALPIIATALFGFAAGCGATYMYVESQNQNKASQTSTVQTQTGKVVRLPQVKTVCFTPGSKCQSKIIAEINAAKEEVLVQSYSFTNKPLGDALIAAYKRGVRVHILSDKGQETAPHTQIKRLFSEGIQVLIDKDVAIQHNKIMIFDQKRVLTGSYNFSNAAETRNAENIVVIEDKKVAARYRGNWTKRRDLSRAFNPNAKSKKKKRDQRRGG